MEGTQRVLYIFIYLSLISQLKTPGFSFLYPSIFASISGVASLGLLPPNTPGRMLPVSWYLRIKWHVSAIFNSTYFFFQFLLYLNSKVYVLICLYRFNENCQRTHKLHTFLTVKVGVKWSLERKNMWIFHLTCNGLPRYFLPCMDILE